MAEIKKGQGLSLQLSFLTALHLFWSLVTLNGTFFVFWLVSDYVGNSLVSVVMAEIKMGHPAAFLSYCSLMHILSTLLHSRLLKNGLKASLNVLLQTSFYPQTKFVGPLTKKSGPPTNISLTVTNCIDHPIKTASKSSLKLFCHKSRRITWPPKTDESSNHSWSAHIRHAFRPWIFYILDLCIHKN